MNFPFGAKPLKNQPDQEKWLALPLEDQAYWLLKIIDHYRDTRSIVAKLRENEGYQIETMLVRPDTFDHHGNHVISAVDQSTRWLLDNGFMRQFPGQSDGIFQITQKGFDLIDIFKRDEDTSYSLVKFVEEKGRLSQYEVEPADLLSLFVHRMEKTGKKHSQVTISIGNIHAINLSRLNNVNIQLPSLLSAARVCIARGWLETNYLNSNEFENLSITLEGISEYDKRKDQDDLRKSQNVIVVGQDSSVLPINVENSNQGIDVDGSAVSDKRNHYVVVIHGIRTQAEYQTKLAKKLEEHPNIKAITLGYEFFDVIRFLTIGRNGPIDKITRDIRDVKTMEPLPEQISIIAHSFGTYIVSKILERNTDINFHRVIFCGSIVPSTFRWDKYKDRFETPVLNDCGMFDIWPVFAKFATWGYGPSGRFGFKSNRVRDRFHRFKHSDFFKDGFYEKYWMPFLETGEVVEGELERESTSWLVSVLTLVKAPIVAIVLVVCFLLNISKSNNNEVSPSLVIESHPDFVVQGHMQGEFVVDSTLLSFEIDKAALSSRPMVNEYVKSIRFGLARESHESFTVDSWSKEKNVNLGLGSAASVLLPPFSGEIPILKDMELSNYWIVLEFTLGEQTSDRAFTYGHSNKDVFTESLQKQVKSGAKIRIIFEYY